MDSISKQKKYLSENLVVESLRMYESNQEDIKEFLQAKSGSIIAEYLNNKAWNEDSSNDTRVFLVRDCFLQALFPQKCRLTSSKLHGEFPQYCISSAGTLSGAGEEPLQAYKVY